MQRCLKKYLKIFINNIDKFEYIKILNYFCVQILLIKVKINKSDCKEVFVLYLKVIYYFKVIMDFYKVRIERFKIKIVEVYEVYYFFRNINL